MCSATHGYCVVSGYHMNDLGAAIKAQENQRNSLARAEQYVFFLCSERFSVQSLDLHFCVLVSGNVTCSIEKDIANCTEVIYLSYPEQ